MHGLVYLHCVIVLHRSCPERVPEKPYDMKGGDSYMIGYGGKIDVVIKMFLHEFYCIVYILPVRGRIGVYRYNSGKQGFKNTARHVNIEKVVKIIEQFYYTCHLFGYDSEITPVRYRVVAVLFEQIAQGIHPVA